MPSSIPVSARFLRGAAIPFLAACASCTSLIGGKAEIRENRKFIIESGQLELNLPNSERPYALHVEVGKFDVSRLYDRNQIILRKSAEEVRDMAYEAGDMEMYEKGVQVTSGGGASIERAAELAVMLGSDHCGALSGRLIRANLDTFENIPANVDAIMASDAYLLRRVNP